ncbi:MAG TPA: SDR family NAD(P)-dependent oxidoreductase, partial [Alphaproteobacteria bacterium]|nr:SDR family NAD(P)-dependent oxidoreductase [Alphaproteobacteria bacterium]
TDADTRRIFETNVFGLLNVTRRVLPAMRRQNGGHILMMSSVSGLVAGAGAGLYAATKFAVEGLSESLANEVATFGIRVTILEPGPFRTDFSNRSLSLASEMPEYAGTAGEMRRYYAAVDGKQPGDPARAAKAILELVGSDAPPRRLLLGRTALDRLAAKRARHDAEIEAWRDVTLSADFE